MKTGLHTIPIADRKFGNGGFTPVIGLLSTPYFAWGATR
jgi:hypothetical protein